MTQQPGWTNPQGQPGGYGQPADYGQPQYGQPVYGQVDPYQQPGYGQPVYAYPPDRPTNSMAIVALVLALTVPPGGLICGHIARKQIAETGEEGHGLAMAGMIIGGISTGLVVLLVLFYIVIFIVALTAMGSA